MANKWFKPEFELRSVLVSELRSVIGCNSRTLESVTFITLLNENEYVLGALKKYSTFFLTIKVVHSHCKKSKKHRKV